MSQFHEVQYVRQNRLFIVIWLPAVIMWVLFFQQIILGQMVGNQPAPDWFVILLWILLGWGLPVVYFIARMTVEVTAKHIAIWYIPFVNRNIAIADITDVEKTMYSPMTSFGGWGIRMRFDGTFAYTVIGNQGVMLTLTDGKQVLIGSQRSDELARSIQSEVSTNM